MRERVWSNGTALDLKPRGPEFTHYFLIWAWGSDRTVIPDLISLILFQVKTRLAIRILNIMRRTVPGSRYISDPSGIPLLEPRYSETKTSHNLSLIRRTKPGSKFHDYRDDFRHDSAYLSYVLSTISTCIILESYSVSIPWDITILVGPIHPNYGKFGLHAWYHVDHDTVPHMHTKALKKRKIYTPTLCGQARIFVYAKNL